MKNIQKTYKNAYDGIKPSQSFNKEALERVFNDEAEGTSNVRVNRAAIVLAAALSVVMIFAGTVFAVENFRGARLSQTAQFSSAADVYAEAVDLTAEHDGLIVTLSEALYENGKLYITFNYRNEETQDFLFVTANGAGGALYIDGQECNSNRIKECSEINGEYLCTYEYDLTASPLEGEHTFTLVFDALEVTYPDMSTRVVEGPWEYSFKMDTSRLDDSTCEYEINEVLAMENGDTILVEKLVCSPVSQQLHYTIVPAEGNKMVSYLLYADASDSKGNRYHFTFSEGSSGSCRSVNISPDSFCADAETIRLEITVTDRYGNILLDDMNITAKK